MMILYKKYQRGGITKFPDKVKSVVNPKNWGVKDYTDKGDFNNAFYYAKIYGDKEFMWNNKRYNTGYGGTPRQEVGSYGVNGNSVNISDLNNPVQVNLHKPFGEYLPGHIESGIYQGDLFKFSNVVNKNGVGTNIPKISPVGDKVINVYNAHDYNNSTGSIVSKNYNLLKENCADAVCDSFGINRSGISTPGNTLKKIQKKYNTLDITNRTLYDYKFKLIDDRNVLENSNYWIGIMSSPDVRGTDLGNKIVSKIQSNLIKKGYTLPKSTKKDGKPDGVFGEETKQALLDYQTKSAKKYQFGGITKFPVKEEKKVSHKMSVESPDGKDWYAFPTVDYNPKTKEWIKFEDNWDAYDYHKKNNSLLKLPSKEFAMYYGENGLIDHGDAHSNPEFAAIAKLINQRNKNITWIDRGVNPGKYPGLTMSEYDRLEGYKKYQSGGTVSLKARYQNSGPYKTKLSSNDEMLFSNFYKTLPDNLKTDDDSYDIRGYWDALERPDKFDYSQPKEDDGYYHAFSRHPRTGMYLKSPNHPTFKMAIEGDRQAGYYPMVKPDGRVYTINPAEANNQGKKYQSGGSTKFPYENKSVQDNTYNRHTPVFDIPAKQSYFSETAKPLSKLEQYIKDIKEKDLKRKNIGNTLTDMGTGVAVMGTQFRKPTQEEYEKARDSWAGKSEILMDAASWGLADVMTGEAASKAIPYISKASSKLVKKKVLGNTPNVKPAFKSEVDWAKWNKEIPENKALMQEYSAIEEAAKAKGTWMKNSDGSTFTGTPEQFVQQNSENFKKVYPKGFDETYRGDRNHYNIMNEKDFGSTTFSGDKDMALNYTYENAQPFTANSPLGVNPNYGRDIMSSEGLYKLYGKKSKNSIKIDAKNRDYTRLKLSDLAGDDYVSTDDVANYIKSNKIDNATISNVYDSSFKPGTVRINNNKEGNYLKSMFGNNGMFDMTNPNIYKALIPGAVIGGAAMGNTSPDHAKIIKENWLGKYKEVSKLSKGGALIRKRK